MLKRIPFAEHPTLYQGLQAVYNCQEKKGLVCNNIYRTRQGVLTTDASNLTVSGRLRNAFQLTNTELITFDLEKTVGEFFEVGNPYSIDFWVKPSSITGVLVFVSTSQTGGAKGFYIASNGSKFNIGLQDGGGLNYVLLESSTDVFTIGDFYHVSINYGGGAIKTDWSLFINGVSKTLVDAGSAGILTTFAEPSKSFGIGYPTPGNHFAGTIEQLGIWNRALSAGEVSWLAEGHVADMSIREVV